MILAFLRSLVHVANPYRFFPWWTVTAWLSWIALTLGLFAALSQWNWNTQGASHRLGATRTRKEDRKCIYMHREIMQAPDGIDVDHVDGNRLNNRRSNLRLATHQQNTFNKGPHRNNTSGIKGVSWHKRLKKWQVQLNVNGKRVGLGYFSEKAEAAKAYERAARKHHGVFARTCPFAS
jgi:HNH endonuclease/AP2 domain-containing protein